MRGEYDHDGTTPAKEATRISRRGLIGLGSLSFPFGMTGMWVGCIQGKGRCTVINQSINQRERPILLIGEEGKCCQT